MHDGYSCPLVFESNNIQRCLASNCECMGSTETTAKRSMKKRPIWTVSEAFTNAFMAMAETKGTSYMSFGEILSVLAVLVVEKRSIQKLETGIFKNKSPLG